MTDSLRNLSDRPEDSGRKDFIRFLSTLSPDNEEACRRYNSLHAHLVGFFNMKGVSDPSDAADDVMDRAGRKINEGAPVPNVKNFCLGIARNVAKERLRRARRESSAFITFAGDFNQTFNEEVERINRLLKPCFEQLTPKHQQLLRMYCQDLRGRARAEHRQMLADEMKTTQKALRIRITRLRRQLRECVKNRSKSV